MVGGVADTDMVGVGLTVMLTVCGALVQPAVVPVTVYVILEVGVAVTGEPVVALKSVLGDQV